MIDVRSQPIEVSRERGQYPQLEIRGTALFGHLKDVLEVTDLSLSGVFVETDNKSGGAAGQFCN